MEDTSQNQLVSEKMVMTYFETLRDCGFYPNTDKNYPLHAHYDTLFQQITGIRERCIEYLTKEHGTV